MCVRRRRGIRNYLDERLPELKALPGEPQEAVDAIASFDTWHRLRAHQGQSKKASIYIVSGLLKRLIIEG